MELANIFDSETAWPTLAESLAAEHPGLEVLNDPVTLHAGFIDEVLLDTHAAFFNGYAQQADPLTLDSRAWKHFGYLMELLKWSDLTTADKYDLIREVAEAEIPLLQEAKRWKELTQLGQQLVSYCPDSVAYEELLWNTRLSEKIAYYLTAYGGGTTSLNAAIEALEYLRKNNPLIFPIYEKLGSLQHDLAVDLAEQGFISTALVAAQKAVTFSPSDKHVALLAQLTQLMQKTKKEAEEYDLRGLRFKNTGVYMLDEVRVGFRLLENYNNSDEPTQIAEALRAARAQTLGRNVGLPEPAERQKKSAVCLLKPATAAPSQQAAPSFDFWLLSGRDLRLKIQAVAALVLLFVAGTIFIFDMYARHVRDASYQSVIQGSQTRNYLQVIEGAETFLSHPLIASGDIRDEEVIEHYNKALVLWVARQPGQINTDVSARVERYRQLVGNRNGGRS